MILKERIQVEKRRNILTIPFPLMPQKSSWSVNCKLFYADIIRLCCRLAINNFEHGCTDY